MSARYAERIKLEVTKTRRLAVWELGGNIGVSVDRGPLGIAVVWAKPDGTPYQPYFVVNPENAEPNGKQALVPAENGAWYVYAYEWSSGRYGYEIHQISEVHVVPGSYGFADDLIYYESDGDPSKWISETLLADRIGVYEYGYPPMKIPAFPIALKGAIDAALEKCRTRDCKVPHYIEAK